MTSTPVIELRELCKAFRVSEREPGLGPALAALFRRQWREVEAVRSLSFSIERGERVGFLGPNGAGKTTTLKMLAGLLHPSSGELRVLGYEPARRRPEFLRGIALVMGQKRQLSWDLPALDTFELNRVVYDVPRVDFDARLAEMIELLEIGGVVRKPVRTLSLGERMKCELVAALLHGPQLLFLDEPTIGMDVSMQLALRRFILEYQRRHDATVVLTSHYMEDVVALCDRVLVIDEGELRFDGGLQTLVRQTRPLRRVSIHTQASLSRPEQRALEGLGQLVGDEAAQVVLDVDPSRVPEAVAALLALPGARELEVRDAPLAEVMRELFTGGSTREGKTNERAGE